MEYSLHHMSRDELFNLLDSFSTKFLVHPIKKAQKYFAQKAKGFRLNKLPKNLLYKIYYDEISSAPNTPLENHLLSNIVECFENVGIPDVIDNSKGNVFELSSQLESLIYKSEIKISPHAVLLICKYDCSAEDLSTIKRYHDCFIEAIAEQQKIYNDKYDELQSRSKAKLEKVRQRADEKYSLLDHKYREFQNILKECEGNVELAEAENKRLNDSAIETARIIEQQKQQLQDYESLRKRESQQKTEISLLNEQVDQLKAEIKQLESKVLSPNDTLDLCKTVLEDLKLTGLDEKELKEYAHKIFDENTSIVEAWDILSEFDRASITSVFYAMQENDVCGSNIDILDGIENNVYMRYLIIKNLKVLFFKFLEQNAKKKQIERYFQSEA